MAASELEQAQDLSTPVSLDRGMPRIRCSGPVGR
jgi:hypothetical protein